MAVKRLRTILVSLNFISLKSGSRKHIFYL
nr:MAG TPA: hypothetical protein [Caudoviricetes sp.]